METDAYILVFTVKTGLFSIASLTRTTECDAFLPAGEQLVSLESSLPPVPGWRSQVKIQVGRTLPKLSNDVRDGSQRVQDN